MKGIYATVVEPQALALIYELRNHPAISWEDIAIMPDVHLGVGTVIGFTGKFKDDLVIPNVVGVDIGCGIITYPLGNIKIDFEALDEFITNTIPTDFNCRTKPFASYGFMKNEKEILAVIRVMRELLDRHDLKNVALPQLGTLGGGNHFIEIEADEEGNKYCTIHSGSRNFGKTIADFHQKLAIAYCEANNIRIPKAQAYYPNSEYLKDMFLAQKYASWNRLVMLFDILEYLGINFEEDKLITSVHNYIDPRDNIIRKGAISAYEGESAVIPLNMGSEGGILIVDGHSPEECNFSAPHGAGRVMSRSAAKRAVDSDPAVKAQIRESVTAFCRHIPVSEAPMVYKSYNDIKDNLEKMVTVKVHAKPLYCFKGL